MIRIITLDTIELDRDFQQPLLEGVLEVPKNTKVVELPISHFKRLIDKKGRTPVIRALTNLQNWFKYKKPSLSNWAIDMKKSIGEYGRKK